ncbi:Guanine nucleotide-binding protein G(I)/G(S)/G(O) subunit gamma-10 [Saguinus oedipus]|uniref:Guanine nucleotide-binding protein subunit gamma n=1 Tax=Saguinus oedipus TaxID=9490 RepID=A0ABQ9TI94_SAGOE|nr:Guanine nucleotide-binding protein G(I)/G(S)/G(O) subunit gamma-10 [Saguinus oedipus]
MSSGASANALQCLVEQLKLEAAVERIKVSQAAAELQQYCMQNACKDALLVAVPAGSNPFPYTVVETETDHRSQGQSSAREAR